jgi:hypothetical protein
MTNTPSDPTPSSQEPLAVRPKSSALQVLQRRSTWVALASLTAVALMFWAIKAITAETKLNVSCDPIKGGYVCKITPSGARLLNAKVCWQIHDVCENGVKSMVSKCIRDTLAPGSEIRSLIANSEFSNYGSCDKISAREVESLYMEVVRDVPATAQK